MSITPDYPKARGRVHEIQTIRSRRIYCDIMIKKLLAFIKDLVYRHFYGKIVISFEDGKVVHLKKEESVSVKEL